MAISNEQDGTTETSPLLNKATAVPIDTPANSSPNGIIDAGKAINGTPADPAAAADPERGAAEEPDNPIFEGLPEVASRLHILAPALAISVFLAAADQTIIVTTYGRIGSEMNALNNTSWIATAYAILGLAGLIASLYRYFLTLTTFQPLYGKLSDIFGRKSMLLSAYAIFGLGCLFCGLARSMEELVAARALAGVGGGGMTTVTSILFSDIIPLRKRGTWQGYINVVFAFGASLGAPIGGVCADSIGWRWLFIGQAPLCLIAFLAVYYVLHLPKIEDSHWREKLARIDFLGAYTLVLATFALILGLDRGSNIGWNNTIAIVSVSISIPLFGLFVLVETKWASNPFAPGHIIFERSLVAAYLCNFFSIAGYMAALFYIPLFFQAVDDISAFEAGLRMIPGIIGSVIGSVGGGLLMQKTGKYYWITVMAYFLLICGSLIVFLFSGSISNSTCGIITGLIFCGFGGGMGVTTTLIALIANADAKDQAIATACSYLFRSLGGVIGLSISATVVQQSLRTQLHASLGDGDEADRIVRRVRQSLDYINQLDPAMRDLVRACYQRAINASFGLTVVLVSGAFVSAFYIREKRLSK